MNLVIIIPALNEEATIQQVIRGIPEGIEGIDAVEVVVVDDGSTDRTACLAGECGAQVVSHGSNRGLGCALATGMETALRRGADVLVNIDADGQFQPQSIPLLIAPILEGKADFVTCTRFARPELVPAMPAVKKWGNRLLCRVVNRLVGNGSRFTDVSCGFRAYSRQAAIRLNLFGSFTYTQEMLLDLAAKGVRMAEVPLPVRGEREVGKSRIARSLVNYALQTSMILFRAFRDCHPLLVFGTLGLLVLLTGVALGLLVFGWWCFTGQTSPFRSVLIGSAVCLILGFMSGILALLADMIGRIRRTQDLLLALMREQTFGRGSSAGLVEPPPGSG